MPTVPKLGKRQQPQAKDRPRSVECANTSDGDKGGGAGVPPASLLTKRGPREDKSRRLRRRLAESTDSSTMSLTFFAARAAEAAESVATLVNSLGQRTESNPRGNDQEPMLIVGMREAFTYESLAFMIRQINFDNAAAKASPEPPPCAPEGASADTQPHACSCAAAGRERRKALTPELMRRVANYLTVRAVRQDDVRVVGCSSHDQRHPLESCLAPVDSTWWISGPQTMINGRGRESVEFRLCPADGSESCRRLSSFSLRIPPLPMGPLSVREFELQCRIERFHGGGTDNPSGARHDSSYTYRTLPLTTPASVQNVSGWQDFVLSEPADVCVVRIVCLSNQISRFMDDNPNNRGTILPMIATPFDQVGFYAIRFA